MNRSRVARSGMLVENARIDGPCEAEPKIISVLAVAFVIEDLDRVESDDTTPREKFSSRAAAASRDPCSIRLVKTTAIRTRDDRRRAGQRCQWHRIAPYAILIENACRSNCTEVRTVCGPYMFTA